MITLDTLETQRLQIMAMIQDWPAAKLSFRPAPDAWSATEVLDHVVKVEERTIAVARVGLRSPHRIGLRDRLGFFFIDRLFRSRRRVGVPSSAAEVLPDRMPDLEMVYQRWLLARSELANLVNNLSPDQLRVGVFRHPVSGWMTVLQILRFFSAHMQHHSFQLARLALAAKG